MAKSSIKKESSRSNSEGDYTNTKNEIISSPAFSKDILSFFVSELREIYWTENHLIVALPKMVSAAGKAELKKSIAAHLKLTVQHVKRVEMIFELLGEKIIAKKCDAVEGLTMSAEHGIENTLAGSEVRDISIIMSSLKVENFEITAYNGLIQLAISTGQNEVVKLLKQTLDEEVEASNQLTALSQKK